MALNDVWSKFSGFLFFYGVGTAYTVKQFFWKVDKNVKRPENFTLGLEGGPFPVALVTGGTRGIGLELAKLLVRQRFSLILVARNKSDGEKAVEMLKAINAECPIEFHSVDLSDLSQLKKFVDQVVIKKHKKLHLLVNNAGLMMTPFTLVQNGLFELQWATNLVATVFLTESLLPLLKRAANEDGHGRVINLSSSGMFSHNLSENFLKEMPCTEEHYSAHFAYSNSKLAIALYTLDVQQRLNEENQIFVSDPGYESPINPFFMLKNYEIDKPVVSLQSELFNNSAVLTMTQTPCTWEDTLPRRLEPLSRRNVPYTSNFLISQDQKVTAYSLHPGIISTDLFQHLSAPIRGFFALTKVFYRAAEDAAWDMLHLCLHDQYDLKPGQFYENGIAKPIAQVDSKTREAFQEYIENLRKSF